MLQNSNKMLNFAFREEFSIFTFILCRKCKNSANLVGVDFPSKNFKVQESVEVLNDPLKSLVNT